MRLVLWLCVSAVLAAAADGRRFGGSSRRVPSPKRPPAQSPPRRTESRPSQHTDTNVNNHFLSSERGTASGNTHNRPNPFSNPSPQVPQPHTPIGFDKVNSPSAPKAPSVQTNGPLGFDKVNAGTQQGSPQIGFDKVNSDASKRVPSAPPYPNGPPPAYHPAGNSYSGAGAADHPPSYPGRPVNAPPSYSANHPYNPQPGNYPSQQHPYPAQGFGGSYPQQNQFAGAGYGAYPQAGSYPSNTGYFPANSGGHYPSGAPYQGNAYGGSPFGNTGYNGNPYYNPSNFGYSSNPGYFGSQGGYSNYPGQYQQKQSRFGGLPIPIPIPIPIPLGGFGGFGGFSNNHRLLDSFIKKQDNVTASGNSTTSVFILNNSTVTPCTTDHFVYDLLKVSVVSCTAEHCTAVKLYATTNVSGVVSVHSAGLTMCLENNVTLSHYGDKVTPTVSEMLWQNETVCRDVVNTTVAVSNVTVAANNVTVSANNVTALDGNGTEATLTTTVTEDPATTIVPTTTIVPATTNQSQAVNTTRVCERVDCAFVELCLPSIEVMDPCSTSDCPFRRTGFKPCVTLKMCRSPSTPVSSFATLNTTISKIDEFNNYNSKFDAANLTLISYHRPVVRFDCPLNTTAPGCPPPTNSSSPATPAAL